MFGASTAEPATAWEIVQRAFLTPQPRAQQHKLWGQGGMGLNRGFPRTPEEWDVGQAPFPGSQCVGKAGLTPQVPTCSVRCESSAKPGVTYTHSGGVGSEGTGHTEPADKHKQGNPASRIVGTIYPCVWERGSY